MSKLIRIGSFPHLSAISKESMAEKIVKLENRNKELEDESLFKSIKSACERVGKDASGKFPFNAHDLAERIIGLEAKNKKIEKYWKSEIQTQETVNMLIGNANTELRTKNDKLRLAIHNYANYIDPSYPMVVDDMRAYRKEQSK